jgi:L-threonylcarbamoyladenylate synthase
MTDDSTVTRRLAAHDSETAASILAAGGTVAIPTETVYGLAADASNDEAVAKIFEAKGRPSGHPLIVHIGSADHVARWAIATDPRIAVLAESLWPGPLTLILPRTDRVSTLVVGDRATVGIRVPDHPVAAAVLAAFTVIGSGGVAAPSANRFGHVSPTTAQHVLDDLDGRIDAVVDGGATAVGVESTILELTGAQPTLLRPGGVARETIEDLLGEAVVDDRGGPSRAAGMLDSHYSPRAEVVVATADQVPDAIAGPGRVAVIGPVDEIDTGDAITLVLAEHSSIYAQHLYSALREADLAGVDRIVVVPPRTGPLVDAVLDRLVKAAGPR